MFLAGRRQGRLVGGQFFWLPVGMHWHDSAHYRSSIDCRRLWSTAGISTRTGILWASYSDRFHDGVRADWKESSKDCRLRGLPGVFLVTSTLIPQILGNNLAELNLNNSGYYYDLYYTTPQESNAIAWLGDAARCARYPIQASWDVRRFVFTDPSDVTGNENIIDEYPTLVYQSSWVILDHTATSSGTAISNEPVTGAIIDYRYPIGLLREYKNLVYTDGGAVIYK